MHSCKQIHLYYLSVKAEEATKYPFYIRPSKGGVTASLTRNLKSKKKTNLFRVDTGSGNASYKYYLFGDNASEAKLKSKRLFICWSGTQISGCFAAADPSLQLYS